MLIISDTIRSEVADESLVIISPGPSTFSTACFGQTTPGDSQTLQALLSEVRQLRQDLQTTTIAAQRAQILLYRLQGQEAAVARASQRIDEAGKSSPESKLSGSTPPPRSSGTKIS